MAVHHSEAATMEVSFGLEKPLAPIGRTWRKPGGTTQPKIPRAFLTRPICSLRRRFSSASGAYLICSLQSAAEFALLARMIYQMLIPENLCAQASGVADSFWFDATRIYYFGHSTGSNTGQVAMGVIPYYSGVLFSGAGGTYLQQTINKFEPLPIKSIVETALAIRQIP